MLLSKGLKNIAWHSPRSCTHSHTHTHTDGGVNQGWRTANQLVGSRWGVRCLSQGHLRHTKQVGAGDRSSDQLPANPAATSWATAAPKWMALCVSVKLCVPGLRPPSWLPTRPGCQLWYCNRERARKHYSMEKSAQLWKSERILFSKCSDKKL